MGQAENESSWRALEEQAGQTRRAAGGTSSRRSLGGARLEASSSHMDPYGGHPRTYHGQRVAHHRSCLTLLIAILAAWLRAASIEPHRTFAAPFLLEQTDGKQ